MTSFKTKGRIFRKINWKFNFLQLTSSYIFQAVANAFPSVDTFFLLSGCLVAYLTLKELDKTKGRVNWIMVIVHRYLRYSFTSLSVTHTKGNFNIKKPTIFLNNHFKTDRSFCLRHLLPHNPGASLSGRPRRSTSNWHRQL